MIEVDSLQELDVLVAKSLGWKEVTLYDQAYYVPYHSEWDEDDINQWISDYGISLKFSSNWACAQHVIEQCDRLGLEIEWYRTKDSCRCHITKHEYLEQDPVGEGTGTTGWMYQQHPSMELSLCLAWLHYQGVDFLLKPNPFLPTLKIL